MENQKTNRVQPFSNNSVNVYNQHSSVPSSKSSFANSASGGSFSSSQKTFGNHSSDTYRTKSRGKSYSGDKIRNSGGNRSTYHGHGSSGHQRKTTSYLQSNEVKQITERNGSNRSNEKVSRPKESASHLLNFTYTPLRSQEKGSRSSAYGLRGGKARRQLVQTKTQFLQAHCQFVVKKAVTEDAYVEYMADPDKMVEWDDIEQVVLRDEQISSCPICMEVPIAARITKCAHIYCWPCILHYLSLSDRAWARCPICFDSVEGKELKSVKTIALRKPKVGEEITLRLMKRERESLYVRPKTVWRASKASSLFSILDDGPDAEYSKLLVAAPQYLKSVIAEERQQLLGLLQKEDTLSLEASFVQAALDSLTSREERMGLRWKTPTVVDTPTVVEKVVADEMALVVNAATIKSSPNLQAVSYTDAFAEITEEKCTGDGAMKGQVLPETAEADCTDDSGSSGKNSADDVRIGLLQASADVSRDRVRTISSASSSDGVEAEQLVADLVLPPTGTQPGHASGSKRTEVYYFYQAADGQHVYLHSINTRILAAEYGSLEMAPTMLSATIVEAEDNSMTADLRKKLKYLSHLPLYSQFCVCEVALRPPVVSSACLAHFSDEINQRKRMRSRRQRTETRQYNRAQAEERRRMGKYPDMTLPLDSDRHFPSSYQESSPPSLAEFAPLVEVQPVEAQSQLEDCEHAVPSRQHEVPITTPYSFAQAMKGNTDSCPAWPKMQTSYARSSGPRHATETTNDEAEEGAAPSFQQSFSAGFMLQDLADLSVTEHVDSQQRPGKKVKGKKKKTQVLFSTSSHRGNL